MSTREAVSPCRIRTGTSASDSPVPRILQVACDINDVLNYAVAHNSGRIIVELPQVCKIKMFVNTAVQYHNISGCFHIMVGCVKIVKAEIHTGESKAL